MTTQTRRRLIVAAHGTPDRILTAIRRQRRLYERLGICDGRSEDKPRPQISPDDWGPEAA